MRFSFASDSFSPRTFQKAEDRPLFSTDKEEEGCLKTSENTKIVRKRDSEIVLWWKLMKSGCSDSWGGRPQDHLHWLSASLLACLKAQGMESRSKTIHRSSVLWDFPIWRKRGGSSIILKAVRVPDPFFQRFCAVGSCSPKEPYCYPRLPARCLVSTVSSSV